MKKFIYIAICLLSNLVVAQNNEVFTNANRLYNEGKYQEAIQSYESILNNGVHSSELYFNLANAYYKSNQIAPSIYYYEKAKQLSPYDKDINNNLSFAKNMTIDVIDNIPETGFSRMLKSITNTFNFDTWAVFSVVFVFLFVLLFLAYYFSHSTIKKRLFFISSFIVLSFAILTLFLAFQKEAYNKNDNPAIVFAQESNVKNEPNLRSETAFVLHEGTKVQILEMYNENWTKIKIANGKTGWISNDDIKSLKHF
jgi:tetratricopeptide (TPR) repeat protein